MLDGKADEIRSLQSKAASFSPSELPIVDPAELDDENDNVSHDNDNETTETSNNPTLTVLQPDVHVAKLLRSAIPAFPSNTYPSNHPNYEAQCISDVRKADAHITSCNLRRILRSRQNDAGVDERAAPARSIDESSTVVARIEPVDASNSWTFMLLFFLCLALRLIDVEISW